MKINAYSTEQFAGVRNQEIRFQDGMNVVLGKNEAGKSTMLAAIYHALLTPSKLDKRKNKDFMNQFFPTSGARTIDVTVEIESGHRNNISNLNEKEDKRKEESKKHEREREIYIIEKIWDIDGKENITKVKQKEGDIWRGNQAQEKLSKLLEYGVAFYKNLVFNNQSYEEEVLDWVYQFFSSEGNVDSDITEIKARLAQAFSVAGGISEEKFLSLLDMRMRELSGKWDFQKNTPEKGRGIDNKWRRDIGSILISYYDYKEAQRELEEAIQIEEELAKKTRQLVILTGEKNETEQKRAELESQKAEIFNKSKTEKLLEKVKRELEICKKVSSEWPNVKANLQEGKTLAKWQQILEQREKIKLLEERIELARNLQNGVKRLEGKEEYLEQLSADYEKAKKVSKDIEKNQLRLSSVKLLAEICLKEPYEAKVEHASGVLNFSNQDIRKNIGASSMDSMPCGQEYSVRDTMNMESYQISGKIEQGKDFSVQEEMNGFVRISIPGIAQIQVSPKDLDVKKCQREIEQDTKIFSEILQKYCVETVDDLLEEKTNWQQRLVEREKNERELERVLGSRTLDELDEELLNLQEEYGASLSKNGEDLVESGEKIRDEIKGFLKKTKKTTLEASIAAAETVLQQYENTYETCEGLLQKKKKLEIEEKSYRKQLKQLENISMTEGEYEQKIKALQEKLKRIEQERDELTSQIGSLSQRETLDIAEMEMDVLNLKKEWERKKKTYRYYEKIKEDFIELKKENRDKFEDFNKSFCENLAVITGNKMEIGSFESLELLSGKNKITIKEILSEGTKKTVLLAFRLAILEYFYRNEIDGGIAVFDDILLDMDGERRENSALLLKKFAKKNQVIFTTCDEEIAKILGGNLIRI